MRRSVKSVTPKFPNAGATSPLVAGNFNDEVIACCFCSDRRRGSRDPCVGGIDAAAAALSARPRTR